MIKITEENVKGLTLDGIVVCVPKSDIEDGSHNDISFITECAYFSKGQHGYPKPGHGADNSSFYHIAYNMVDYLPNGLYMNATSRLTWNSCINLNGKYDYYKFKDMEEFCHWYLDYVSKKSTGGFITYEDGYKKMGGIKPPPVTSRPEPPKGQGKTTRREKCKDMLELIQLYLSKEHAYDLYTQSEHKDAGIPSDLYLNTRTSKEWAARYQDRVKALADWLDTEVEEE